MARLLPLCLALLAAGGAVLADPASDALLSKARGMLSATRSVQSDLALTMTLGGREYSLAANARLKKPNLWRVEVLDPNGQPGKVLVSTGKTAYVVQNGKKEYLQLTGTPKPAQLAEEYGLLLAAWLDPAQLTSGPGDRSLGRRTVRGASYEVVEQPQAEGQVRRLYLTPEGTLAGVEVTQGDATRGVWLRNPRLNADVDRAFDYTPPAEFSPTRPAQDTLLAVGQPAPDFRLPRPGGGMLGLKELLRGKKAVLVNFWFTHCAPCRAEHPVLEKLYTELKDQGLGVVAVNAFDTEAEVRQYQKELGLTLPVVLGGPEEKYTLGKAYGVQAYPSNFLVGADGKILWRGVGFHEAELRAALAQAGVGR